MKGCRHVRRRVLLSVDHELPLAEELALEAHLAECADCTRWQREQRALAEALEARPEPPLERLDVEQAVARWRSVQQEPSRSAPVDALGTPKRARRARVWGAIAAAAAVMALGVLALSTEDGRTDLEVEPVARTAVDVPTPDGVAVESLPRETPPAALDDTRPPLERVRGRVRDQLAASFAGGADDETLDDALERFEYETRDLVRDAGWPLWRIVEDLVQDPEPEVARAALHALGRRGDRVAISRVRAAIGREDLADAALDALADLAAAGVDEAFAGLGAALAEEDLALAALEWLAQIGGPSAAVALEAALAEGRALPSRRALLDALARTGPDAVDALLRLARRAEDRSEVLPYLELVPDGRPQLAYLLRQGAAERDVELLLDAAWRLQPEGAIDWVAGHATDRRHRDAAFHALARWEGPAPLALLLELWSEGRVSAERSDRLGAELLERDAGRAAELARDLVRDCEPVAASELLAFLLMAQHARTADALLELAFDECLDEDQRVWAALAVGELGGESDLGRLLQCLDAVDAEHGRLMAACLVSVYALAGDAGVTAAIQPLAPRQARRLFDALEGVSERGTATGLARVARALDDVAAARSLLIRRSNP